MVRSVFEIRSWDETDTPRHFVPSPFSIRDADFGLCLGGRATRLVFRAGYPSLRACTPGNIPSVCSYFSSTSMSVRALGSPAAAWKPGSEALSASVGFGLAKDAKSISGISAEGVRFPIISPKAFAGAGLRSMKWPSPFVEGIGRGVVDEDLTGAGLWS